MSWKHPVYGAHFIKSRFVPFFDHYIHSSFNQLMFLSYLKVISPVLGVPMKPLGTSELLKQACERPIPDALRDGTHCLYAFTLK